jgi:predicted patatin/cPLA2 family phospholipase
MQRLERLSPELVHNQSSGQQSPLLNLLKERNQNGSRLGEREDGRAIALAIEGGGHAGAISAGMCVVLEATGLIDAIDVIYGTSSGALNGSFTAAGQAAIGSTNYEDTANRRFSNPFRLLMKRSIIDFDFLFDDVIRNRKPFDEEGLASGPEFRAVGTNLETRQPEIMKDFANVDELMEAVRASCSIPILSNAIKYKGKRVADGAFVSTVPYKEALEEGATDVLVLRTKTTDARKKPYSPKLIDIVKRLEPLIGELLEARPEIYNDDAGQLESLSKDGHVAQIAPPTGAIKMSQLEHSVKNVRKGLGIGAAATAAAFGLPNIEILWQPSIHVNQHS